MKNALAALVLLAAVTVVAADKTSPPPPKSRSIKSLIDVAMTDGVPLELESGNIDELRIESQHLDQGKLRTKYVYYKQSDSPDHRKHAFSVAYKMDETRDRPTPVFLIWDVISGHKKEGLIYADGYTMRVSLDGKLDQIVSIKGVVAQGVHTRLDVDSPEAKNAFKHEWDFYTRESTKLKLNTK